jgi:hypothetical protein
MGMLRAAANITDSESRRFRLVGYDIIPIIDYLRAQGIQVGNDCHILIRGLRSKSCLIKGKYCAWPELRVSYLAMVCFGQSRKIKCRHFRIKATAKAARSSLHVHPAPLAT